MQKQEDLLTKEQIEALNEMHETARLRREGLTDQQIRIKRAVKKGSQRLLDTFDLTLETFGSEFAPPREKKSPLVVDKPKRNRPRKRRQSYNPNKRKKKK